MALHVTITFGFPRPKSHFRTRNGRTAGLKDSAPYWHTKKPDIDNLAKAVLDAMQPDVMLDDSSICSLYVDKEYVEGTGEIRVMVREKTREHAHP